MEVLKSSIHNCECVREVALIIQSGSNSYDSEVHEVHEVLWWLGFQDNSMLSVCVSSFFCFSSLSLSLWKRCTPLFKMNPSTSK